MLTFGDRLRTEREKRSVSLDAIAAATKIRRSYLEALERNAFGELPGAVFNRGYVRAYAVFLGADPEPLLRAYAREIRVRNEADSTPPLEGLRQAIDRQQESRSGRRPVRLLWAAVIALGALAALGGTWWALHAFTALEETAPVAERSGAPAPAIDTAETQTAPSETSSAPELAPEPVPEPATALPPVAEETRAPVPPLALEPPVAQGPSGLAVSEHGVGTGIRQRTLVGRSNRFPQGGEAWFWTLVVGGHRGDAIRHVWLHEGRVVASIPLAVGGPSWRTRSRQSFRDGSAGSWVVEARDSSDAVLARSEFRVE